MIDEILICPKCSRQVQIPAASQRTKFKCKHCQEPLIPFRENDTAYNVEHPKTKVNSYEFLYQTGSISEMDYEAEMQRPRFSWHRALSQLPIRIVAAIFGAVVSGFIYGIAVFFLAALLAIPFHKVIEGERYYYISSGRDAGPVKEIDFGSDEGNERFGNIIWSYVYYFMVYGACKGFTADFHTKNESE